MPKKLRSTSYRPVNVKSLVTALGQGRDALSLVRGTNNLRNVKRAKKVYDAERKGGREVSKQTERKYYLAIERLRTWFKPSKITEAVKKLNDALKKTKDERARRVIMETMEALVTSQTERTTIDLSEMATDFHKWQASQAKRERDEQRRGRRVPVEKEKLEFLISKGRRLEALRELGNSPKFVEIYYGGKTGNLRYSVVWRQGLRGTNPREAKAVWSEAARLELKYAESQLGGMVRVNKFSEMTGRVDDKMQVNPTRVYVHIDDMFLERALEALATARYMASVCGNTHLYKYANKRFKQVAGAIYKRGILNSSMHGYGFWAMEAVRVFREIVENRIIDSSGLAHDHDLWRGKKWRGK